MSTSPPPGDLHAWFALGRTLHVSPGVHRPSWFSAALAAHLPALTDLEVLDVGSGAGLVTIAALQRGARRVVALDLDPRALEDTGRNVRATGVEHVAGRLTLLSANWTELAELDGDVALVNPPQRPGRLLRGDPDEHVHVGGGDDGLDGVRAVLTHARTTEVISTASSLLRPASTRLQAGAYGPPERLASVLVEHEPIWGALRDAPPTGPLLAEVDLWRFTRADPATR